VILAQGPSPAGLAYETPERVDILPAIDALHIGLLQLGSHTQILVAIPEKVNTIKECPDNHNFQHAPARSIFRQT
jgi:hypothetical protein